MREMLEFETGGEDAEQLLQALAAAKAQKPHLSPREQRALAIEGDRKRKIKGIRNKRTLEYLRQKAERKPPRFLRPDEGPYEITGAEGLKVYALGPPRNEELLLSLDPIGSEEFHLGGDPVKPSQPFDLDGASRAFFAALEEAGTDSRTEPSTTGPFSPRYRIPAGRVLADDSEDDAPPRRPSGGPGPGWYLEKKELLDHYRRTYGREGAEDGPAPWRRISSDWLGDSETLALRLNHEVNNTSLVIAIELPATGKVLLFTGDAQRGSWISWPDLSWSTPVSSEVKARDLLSRTVFYKVGHHGSHNATLAGGEDDDYANLAWMARGDFRSEFVAMIPANTEWARGKKKPWKHPLEAIERALRTKARGRVFRSDIDHVSRPRDASRREWERFKRRITETEMYFEYTVYDRGRRPSRGRR